MPEQNTFSPNNLSIVVAIPCFNEELTIAAVIADFKEYLPEAVIFVFNNASTDRTAQIAKEAGAQVISVLQKGKGRVIRAIFDQIHADAVIIVDGDATYSAIEARTLLQPILQCEADMTVGNRLWNPKSHGDFVINRFGNKMIGNIINLIFHTSFADVLSGYRVFSKRFIQSVPLLTTGFETETELTIQALEEGFTIKEIPVSYKERPRESPSKLRPFTDGWRIILTIAMLLRDHYPLRLYGALALFLYIFSCVLFLSRTLLPLTFIESNILCAFLFFLATIFAGVGFILSAVNTRLREIKQILLRKHHSQ